MFNATYSKSGDGGFLQYSSGWFGVTAPMTATYGTSFHLEANCEHGILVCVPLSFLQLIWSHKELDVNTILTSLFQNISKSMF